ncbi:MAG TPA: hypothetical protein VK982_00025 [Bacteroidales bacterium]|nr:hypothetical protein [Bacteroidales bacterium]
MKTLKNNLTLGGLILIIFAIMAIPIKSNSAIVDKEQAVVNSMDDVPGISDDFWCLCPYLYPRGCYCIYQDPIVK